MLIKMQNWNSSDSALIHAVDSLNNERWNVAWEQINVMKLSVTWRNCEIQTQNCKKKKKASQSDHLFWWLNIMMSNDCNWCVRL